MKINYPIEFLDKVKALFGEDSIQYAYAETGDMRLGSSISKELDRQSCFINNNNKTKTNEQRENNVQFVKLDRLYDSWIEIVENEYDSSRESKTTRERVQA
jgi:hypothetical protein